MDLTAISQTAAMNVQKLVKLLMKTSSALRDAEKVASVLKDLLKMVSKLLEI